MSKGLEELERLAYENACCRCQYWDKKGCSLWSQNKYSCVWLEIKKELKALEFLKSNLKMVGNCLQARAPFCEDGWVFVKEIEGDEEYDCLKEVLE